MKILVTGLCTLHWGRLQYGNIGNYYIIEPLFRELHRVFPEAEIVTTFQMTEEFIEKENITVLPMDMYYSWQEDDLEKAEKEYIYVKEYYKNKNIDCSTAYIRSVKDSTLLINVSGDMWGDNAEHVGCNRFMVDLYKMRTAQLLGVKTVLFGGTPGPFTDDRTRNFAKEVFQNFDLVINREPTSSINLKKWNFEMKKVKSFTCPAFLFNAADKNEVIGVIKEENIVPLDERPLVGFTIGGFNMPVGPYDMWPRDDKQYETFVEMVEYIIEKTKGRVLLISHTNGFELPPNFKLINGRDYPILKQLQEIIIKRGKVSKDQLLCVQYPHLPKITKAIIGMCDMFVTGRVHASVAAITQHTPTIFITYEKNFIPSTKMHGFASLVDMQNYVCEPRDITTMHKKIDECWEKRDEISEHLKIKISEVQEMARMAFDEIRKIL